MRRLMSPAEILRARGHLGPYTAPAQEPAPEPVSEPDPAQVRAWAAEHGLVVAAKGRIPASVLEAYRRGYVLTEEPVPVARIIEF